jgi:hypothetical protein
VFAFFAAEFLEFEPLGAARFLLRAVVAGIADGAFKPDVFAHLWILHTAEPQIRNPNIEIRNNLKIRKCKTLDSDFLIRICFGFRISKFEFTE